MRFFSSAFFIFSFLAVATSSCNTKQEEKSASEMNVSIQTDSVSKQKESKIVVEEKQEDLSSDNSGENQNTAIDIENTASELIVALQYFPFEELETTFLERENYADILNGENKDWKIEEADAISEMLSLSSATESVNFKLFKGTQSIVVVHQYLHPTNQPLSFYKMEKAEGVYRFIQEKELKLPTIPAGKFLKEATPGSANTDLYESAMDYKLTSEGIRMDLNGYTAVVHAGWEGLNEKDIAYYYLYSWKGNEFSDPIRKKK